jgi:hypothetical protein
MEGNTSRRYQPELGERTIRMVSESLPEHESESTAMHSGAAKPGMGRSSRSGTRCARRSSTTNSADHGIRDDPKNQWTVAGRNWRWPVPPAPETAFSSISPAGGVGS